MNYKYLAYVVLGLVLNADSALGESPKSLACGMDGLLLIVKDPRLQDELDISPAQLGQLRELVERVGRNPVEVQALELNESTDLSLVASNARDRGVMPELEKILFPEQKSQLRKKILRMSLPTPLVTFRGNLLAELELPTDVILLTKTKCKQLSQGIDEKIEDIRTPILEKTLSRYNKGQQQKFVDMFGNFYLPKGVLPGPCRVNDISVFGAAKDCGNLLSVANELQLKNGRDPIRKLWNEFISEKKDAAATLATLRQILNQEEHVSIVQRIQRQILIRDLTKLNSPEVVNFLQLDKDQLEHTRKVTEAGQKQMSTIQMTEELRIFDEIRALLPVESRNTLEAFLEGVWERH